MRSAYDERWDTGQVEAVRFGRYTLLDRIAVGGMAEIFLARQAGLEGFEKIVVLKRIRPHLSNQASFVKMFLHEARLAAQLNHPNIVQVYDLGKVADSYFIAMEYIFGRDMRRIIPQAETMGIPFPLLYALKISSQVCEGLYYAHRKTDTYGSPLHIVHRDITPENLFVSFEGTVKILDFGIAKAANQVEHTRAGELKGKLSYMSPEQVIGRQVDHRSDIWSFGAVLYEWITGEKLFAADNDVATLKAITDGKIYRPSYFVKDVPSGAEDIVMKALDRDPAQRYQTAWEMQFEIDRYLAGAEFLPSSVHLSNFLKQLFADELEQERRQLLARAAAAREFETRQKTPGRGGPIQLTNLKAQREMTPADPGNPNEGRRTLPVTLDSQEYETLLELAERNEIAPDELAAELLRGLLKYR